jgi:hypothetical protein
MQDDKERFWLEETDPWELRRRARDFEATSHFGLAEQFCQRADELESAQKARGAEFKPWKLKP